MCGIAGFIGESTDPKLSYRLLTTLFEHLELRGVDAAGVWGAESHNKNRIIFHKEPVRSSEFVKGDFWKKLRNVNMDLAIVHARATSKGGGRALFNKNNHPFVSKDYNIGLVHNGTLDECSILSKKYETVSSTDSELILRMYEHAMEQDTIPIQNTSEEVSKIMMGVRNVWSHISTGAMAVAIGEKISEEKRNLTLFRNFKRPLWLADLRNLLGQIFFFSTPEIWYQSVCNDPVLNSGIWSSHKLIEMPYNQSWLFQLNKKTSDLTYNKFQITATISNNPIDLSTEIPVKSKKRTSVLLTQLNKDEEVINKTKTKASNKTNDQTDIVGFESFEDYAERMRSEYKDDLQHSSEKSELAEHVELMNEADDVCTTIDAICCDIIDIISEINSSIATTTNIMNDSVKMSFLKDCINDLRQNQDDLETTLRLLNAYIG